MTANQIFAEVVNHVGHNRFSEWYAGIAADVEDRLFNAHGVDRNNGRWIYRPAPSSVDARLAENMLLNAGFDGGPSGGSIATSYVYAYEKTPSTNE
jgi:hypothetical protein